MLAIFVNKNNKCVKIITINKPRLLKEVITFDITVQFLFNFFGFLLPNYFKSKTIDNKRSRIFKK